MEDATRTLTAQGLEQAINVRTDKATMLSSGHCRILPAWQTIKSEVNTNWSDSYIPHKIGRSRDIREAPTRLILSQAYHCPRSADWPITNNRGIGIQVYPGHQGTLLMPGLTLNCLSRRHIPTAITGKRFNQNRPGHSQPTTIPGAHIRKSPVTNNHHQNKIIRENLL